LYSFALLKTLACSTVQVFSQVMAMGLCLLFMQSLLVYPSVVICSLVFCLVPISSFDYLILLLQMEVSLLSEIHKDSNQWTIRVLVSRMWNYRGGTDEGPIIHVDVVLLDKEVGTKLHLL
jgi:hypothetical protein